MLHSKYFEEILKRNQGVKDIRFKFASVAVFVRRVLDKMELYSKADIENDITCAMKQDFDEFDITVDKKCASSIRGRYLEYGSIDYNIIEQEDEGLMSREYEELKSGLDALRAEIAKQNSEMIYNYVDENMPEWARPTIQKMMDKGLLIGDENGCFGLTEELLRVFVTNDRAGLYDHRWDGKSE